MTYSIDASFKYVVTLEAIAGMDFIRLYEDMENVPADALGAFEFAWTGCEFSRRQGPNHPYNFPQKPLSEYSRYPWESISPVQMDTQFGVSPGMDSTGKMPFSLRLFDPWSDAIASSFANFWSDISSDAAMVFIDRMEMWEDHEYAVWHSSPRLAVEFVYRKPTLQFVYKIGRGSRSSCIGFYDHAKDIEAMKTLEHESSGIPVDGAIFKTGMFPTSHALNLQNWQGTLSLDKTKDWMLTYAGGRAKPVFVNSPYKNADEFYQAIIHNEFVNQLALSGTRQNHGFGPTSSRQILESWIPGYQVFGHQLTRSQRSRVEAVMLLMAYVHAGEDYMPMRPMLAGHPNFLSDVRSTPCGMAFLFPEHPAAEEWSDEFEAYLSLNTRYHTRPAVEAWGTRGGRWTENLGTYVWAFLRPASRGAFCLKSRDGVERLCNSQLAELGDWLVNALSAPFAGESPTWMKQIVEESARNVGSRRHFWGIVDPAGGPRRVHPPLGAHSERRKTPRTMWYLGRALMNYSPLTAEHIMWAARPTDQDMEATVDQGDPFNAMYSQPDNRGTNPHLQSAKYTGYGITLRAAVDTPRELSIHLLQIDDGPNYRWGTAGEGACGIIYFYANGKAYSHNGGEDAGDRIDQDTDFSTNFGVWKGGAFRSIGQNVLSRPLYDLSFAQLAHIVPREGTAAYSWPEYVGRIVLLAGDDYFLIYDRVFNPEINHRFSWFVRKGDDFPHIAVLSGNARQEAGLLSSVETDSTSGRWMEGAGDSLVLITHKDGIAAERAPFGARVHVAEGTDLVFMTGTAVQFQEGKKSFSGTSGILRERKDGTHVALFHGTHIGAAGLSFTTSDTELGISATISADKRITGMYFAPSVSEVEIGLPPNSDKLLVYIDGAAVDGSRSSDGISIKLPAGQHQWELTAGLPVPLAPKIERTESAAGGAIVYGEVVASAPHYTLEMSSDNATTWTERGSGADPAFTLTGLGEGKYHVRLIARNAAHSSAPGPEYPVYVTNDPPAPPDGLRVELSKGAVEIHWGEVLGTTEYRLYRKSPTDSGFRVVYAGRSTRWQDLDAAVGGVAVPRSSRANPSVGRYTEYYVTSVSHIGESRPSRSANTDPNSWRNWNPTPGERFRRTVERTEGSMPNDGMGRYYPE
jgi:hypothetical protein